MLGFVWSVFYPILMYYMFSGFAFFGMTILFGEQPEIYMLKQLVSSAVTIPFLLTLWKQEQSIYNVVYGKEDRQPFMGSVLTGMMLAMGTACIGMACNNFIAMTPLVEVSTGFKEVNVAFFSGNLWVRLLASCVIVPIAEELLFRGVVLSRVVKIAGLRWGIFFSAVLFGIVHVNLVQFLYATLLGVILASLVVKTKKIVIAVLAHAMTNLMAIIRTETGFLDFTYQADLPGITVTILMLLLGSGILLLYFLRTKKKTSS